MNGIGAGRILIFAVVGKATSNMDKCGPINVLIATIAIAALAIITTNHHWMVKMGTCGITALTRWTETTWLISNEPAAIGMAKVT